MLKTRELIIILFFVGVLAGVLYFWFYLQPARRRIEERRVSIVERTERLEREHLAAAGRRNVHRNLSNDHDVFRAAWIVEAAALPQRFNDVQVLRHIQEVVYPHTREIRLTLTEPEEREGDELWSTTVSLAFTTSYWQFLSILHNLVQGELGNRVVNYDFSVMPMEPTDFIEMVEAVLIYMPDYIVEQFRSDFVRVFVQGDQDVEFIGLYMLEVNMEIDYLSIEPGVLGVNSWLLDVTERLDEILAEGEDNV
jgi:hypothetical protein